MCDPGFNQAAGAESRNAPFLSFSFAPERVLDIAFCLFESIQLVSWGSAINKGNDSGLGSCSTVKYGFMLSKADPLRNTEERKSSRPEVESSRGVSARISSAHPTMHNMSPTCTFMIFVVESYAELVLWQSALEPYVVQATKIEKVYEFQNKIGQGSFGSVYKAVSILSKNLNSPKKPQMELGVGGIGPEKSETDLNQIREVHNDGPKIIQLHKIAEGEFNVHDTLQDGPGRVISSSNNREEPLNQEQINMLQKNNKSNISQDPHQQQTEPIDRQLVAIKKLKKRQISASRNGILYLLNEIKVHWALEQCSCIVRLLQLFEDEHSIYMVLEYQPKGTLMTVLESASNTAFTEPQARMIVEQLLLALDFFQRKKIVHRDIKMDNILISSIEDRSEYEIRVADFGLAVFTPDDELLTAKCGSPGFVAPEVFRGPHYSYKADVFSLGSVFYQLLTGEYLFDGRTAKSIMKRNIECDLSHTFKHMKRMSSQCRDLLIWMLEADPEERPTAKQALGHQWFKCDKQVLRDLLLYNSIVCSEKKLASSRGGQSQAAISKAVSGILQVANASGSQPGGPIIGGGDTSRVHQEAISAVGSDISGMMNSFLFGNNFYLRRIEHNNQAAGDGIGPSQIEQVLPPESQQESHIDNNFLSVKGGRSNVASGSFLMVPSFKNRNATPSPMIAAGGISCGSQSPFSRVVSFNKKGNSTSFVQQAQDEAEAETPDIHKRQLSYFRAIRESRSAMRVDQPQQRGSIKQNMPSQYGSSMNSQLNKVSFHTRLGANETNGNQKKPPGQVLTILQEESNKNSSNKNKHSIERSAYADSNNNVNNQGAAEVSPQFQNSPSHRLDSKGRPLSKQIYNRQHQLQSQPSNLNARSPLNIKLSKNLNEEQKEFKSDNINRNYGDGESSSNNRLNRFGLGTPKILIEHITKNKQSENYKNDEQGFPEPKLQKQQISSPSPVSSHKAAPIKQTRIINNEDNKIVQNNRGDFEPLSRGATFQKTLNETGNREEQKHQQQPVDKRGIMPKFTTQMTDVIIPLENEDIFKNTFVKCPNQDEQVKQPMLSKLNIVQIKRVFLD